MTGSVLLIIVAAVTALLVSILMLRRRDARRGAPSAQPAQKAEAAPEPVGAAPSETPPAGDDVRFTVYRPSVMAPLRWYQLLVFAHRVDEPSAPAQPARRAELVRREATRLLGTDAASYSALAEDSAVPIPREGQLTFMPEIPGFRFNPPRASMDWLEDVQNVAFRMCADEALDGTSARGRLTVWWGAVLLAEMALVIRVSTAATGEVQTESESAAPFRKVFASYSRKDAVVVRQLEAYARALGDQYLIDVAHIRAGERWQPRIEQLIEEADVFQLFWSWNSMRSEYVQREWRHALSLGRENFVRPVYWEEPLPQSTEHGLPPAELTSLHFQRVPLAAAPGAQIPAAQPREHVRPTAAATPPAQPVPRPTAPAPSAPRRMTAGWLAAAAMLVLAVGSVTFLTRVGSDAAPGEVALPGAVDTGSMPTSVPPRVDDVVVAEFVWPAGDPELAALARELTTALGETTWNARVVVASRPSVPAARAMARQRGADWVLSGEIQRGGDSTIVVARLTAADGDSVAWTDTLRVTATASAPDIAARIARSAEAAIR